MYPLTTARGYPSRRLEINLYNRKRREDQVGAFGIGSRRKAERKKNKNKKRILKENI
jgi:hypothetical protein